MNNNNVENVNLNSLEKIFGEVKPNTLVVLNTDQGEFKIKAVKDEKSERGLIGINLDLKTKVKEGYGKLFGKVFIWFHLLIMWLATVNIGVGLFNLLPLGPVDGGRMFYSALLVIIKDEKKAKKIWAFVGFMFLFLVAINLLPQIASGIVKFFNFLIGLIV